MTCEDLKTRLYELAEGTLSPAEQDDLRSRIESRPECQELLRSIESLQEALPEWKTPEPSPGFVSRAVAAVEADAARRTRVTETVELGRPSLLASALDLFKQKLRVPVPLGIGVLALFLLSALINLKFLVGDNEVAPGDGPDLTLTPVSNPSSVDPVEPERQRPQAEVLLIDRPEKKEDEEKSKEEEKDEKPE